MKNTRLIVIILAGAALLALWQFLASPKPPPEPAQAPGDVPATQTKEYILDVGDSAVLDFAELTGSITIFAGPPGQVKAIVTRRSFGVDKQSAQQDVASFVVEPQRKGEAISFSIGKSAKPGRQVDYKITAPPHTSVKVANASGNITMNGLTGDVEIAGRNLNIALTDIRGAITIRGETGNIKLADTTGALSIQSRASSVQLDRSTGPSILVATGANTTVKDSGAEAEATFRLQNGDLTLTRFRAQTLTAHAPNGQVRINESTAGQLELQTQDGKINLFRVNAENLHATTTSGEVAMDQVQGSFEIKTQRGAVSITEAAAAALSIAAGTGSVVFYGALPVAGEHTISTTSGDISIFVVKESAFRLDATTKGQITIDPPFVLESASKAAGRWRGIINQGTTSLILTSTSGNILISSEQPF